MTSQQIQYGGRLPYWKSCFGYISTIYRHSKAKFGKKKHDHVQIQVKRPKYQISKIQDGRRPPFWKWFNRYISAANHPFSMRFGVLTQILVLKTVTWQSIKICKFKMAGGHHIENRLWLMIYCAINAKFSMKKHDHVWHRLLDQIPNLKNSRWWTAAILKMVLLLCLGRGSSDFDEIWCRCKILIPRLVTLQKS